MNRKKDRTELDNDALPPLLCDEVRYDQSNHQTAPASTSAGRDAYVNSRVTQFVRAHLEIVLVVQSVILAAALIYIGMQQGTIQAQQLENAKLERSTKQTIDLQRENFADFIRLVYNPLAAKVDADHFIIEYLGLERAAKQEKPHAEFNTDHHRRVDRKS